MSYVFISYRHESVEHTLEVRRLAELLRQAKIPVEFDEFYMDANAGGPDEGWARWCEERVENCRCMLIVPSRSWVNAYRRKDHSHTGHGASMEADLVVERLYQEKGKGAWVRLAYVDDFPASRVPLLLRRSHFFNPLKSAAGLESLISWLAQRLGTTATVKSPTVKWPAPKASFNPDLGNRHKEEWPAICNMLAGASPHRLLILEAEHGFGKSELLQQSRLYAEGLGIPVVRLDLLGHRDVPSMLNKIGVDLEEHLPTFIRADEKETHLLVKDLRARRKPVLFLVDTYDRASPEVSDWFSQHFLAELPQLLGVAVILAGRNNLPAHIDLRWRSLARHLPLGKIPELKDWISWLERNFPTHTNWDMRTLIAATDGVPKIFTDLCRTLAKQPIPPQASLTK